jgi:hypothetical protein
METNLDKIVLICATGRSGSTTLQRIINTIPNSNICGENYGAINNLLEFYYKLKYATINYVPGKFKPTSYETIISKNIKPSWYNSYDFVQIVNTIRSMIINMFKKNEKTNVWGFKEIRYDNGNIKYIQEFKELFPQVKVIIQVRENILEQSKSSWYKDNPNSLKYLNNLNNDLYKFYNNNREFCYFTTFEKMFDKENIKNIFKFIDCEKYYNERNVIDILNNNIKD